MRRIFAPVLAACFLAGPALADECRCKCRQLGERAGVLNFGVDVDKLGQDADARAVPNRIVRFVDAWIDFPERLELAVFYGVAAGSCSGVLLLGVLGLVLVVVRRA